jgi:hypothetical protein
LLLFIWPQVAAVPDEQDEEDMAEETKEGSRGVLGVEEDVPPEEDPNG